MTAAGTDLIELAVGDSRAELRLSGAELTRWSVGGRDLLWEKDATVWDATAPILFPIVGWAAGGEIRVGGRAYPIDAHGFARAMRFAPVELRPARARLALESSPQTLALYPFAFRLTVSYTLLERGVIVGLETVNCGCAPMPYACGLHPGLRWPFAGGAQEDYAIEFSDPEAPFVPEISPAGLFRASRRPVPLEERRLALSPALFAAEALCFLGAKSRRLSFSGPDGAALKISTCGFDHVALWSRPGAPFLSVESWTGHGDPEGFTGDLYEKPSMRVLPPGGTGRCAAYYELAPARA